MALRDDQGGGEQFVTCLADRCLSANHGPLWSRGLAHVLEVSDKEVPPLHA